jgi:hypothetical protein
MGKGTSWLEAAGKGIWLAIQTTIELSTTFCILSRRQGVSLLDWASVHRRCTRAVAEQIRFLSIIDDSNRLGGACINKTTIV